MIELAAFGRTGHESSRVIFGAAALGAMRQDRADALLPILDRYGVNHLDTAASYGDSELRLAPWLVGRRNDFFLATKTGDRTGDAARASLERSLERLGVDHVDLIQLPQPGRGRRVGGGPRPRWRRRGPGQGPRRGPVPLHRGDRPRRCASPACTCASLERFDADSVLFPYNHALLSQPAYAADVEALLERVRRAPGGVPDHQGGGPAPLGRRQPPHFSWYEPIEDLDALGRAVRNVLGRPQLFLNTSSDARLLEATLAAADARGPAPSAAELDADVLAQGITPSSTAPSSNASERRGTGTPG